MVAIKVHYQRHVTKRVRSLGGLVGLPTKSCSDGAMLLNMVNEGIRVNEESRNRDGVDHYRVRCDVAASPLRQG